MKNFLVSVFLSLLIGPGLLAQNTSIGLKAGPLWSSISNTNGSTAIGLRAGAFLTYSISQDFGICGELNYARKGQTQQNGQRLRLDYVEVPLMAHYFFGKGDCRPKVMIGPYFGYLLQAKRNEQTLSGYAQSDYGAVVGLGFHKRLGKSRWLYADVRYQHGLTPIAGSDQANRDVSLNIGVSFPFLNLE